MIAADIPDVSMIQWAKVRVKNQPGNSIELFAKTDGRPLPCRPGMHP